MKIVWSARASDELMHVAQYLAEEFGKRAVERMIQETQKWVSRLELHPEIGRPEPLLADKKIKYRSLIFTKHNKMIYYIHDETIRIADIWDMRRNPSVLANRIRTK